MQGPITFTNVALAITAATPQDLVTPSAATKKVRLLGYNLSPSVASAVLFKDGGNADALLLRGAKCAVDTPDSGGARLPADGVLVPTANGKLRIDATVTATLTGWVATSEE